jgi:hypothetical protein
MDRYYLSFADVTTKGKGVKFIVSSVLEVKK